MDAFFEDIKAYFPPVVTVTSQSDAEVIEETTGQLQSVFTVTPSSGHTGPASSNPYSAASGAVVTWRTAGVRNGRRVHGRTFLVPLNQAAYAADGTLSTLGLSALNAAATTLASAAGAPDLGIWARPTAPAATDGEWFAVNSFSIPDMAAVLRSRRD